MTSEAAVNEEVEVGAEEDNYDELEAALKGEVDGAADDDAESSGDGEVAADTGDTSSGDDGDTADTAVADDAVKEDEKPAEEEKPPSDEEVKEDKPPAEDANLRQTLRELKKQNALLQAKLDRLAAGMEEELNDEGEKKPPEYSGIEKYQQEINEIANARKDTLAEMVELMSLNPKFEDVGQVCTRARFDDIFEAAAQKAVEEHGGTVEEAALALEAAVWKMPNPYKYMYGVIKQFHPDFAQQEAPKSTETKVEDAKTQEKPAVKEKVPAKAPISAVDLGTGGDGKNVSGWTAAKIDALDELELDKVPTNVYQMYLEGKLD